MKATFCARKRVKSCITSTVMTTNEQNPGDIVPLNAYIFILNEMFKNSLLSNSVDIMMKLFRLPSQEVFCRRAYSLVAFSEDYL